MTIRSTKHGTFSLERNYATSPAAVFAAWSNRDSKRAWFAAADDDYALDFRVGGTEAVHGPAGTGLVAQSQYHDIVPDERIVYTTALSSGGILSTVSLTTVQFASKDGGTLLTLTEQGTYLDDQEQPAWRERGTGDWLDALGREVNG